MKCVNEVQWEEGEKQVYSVRKERSAFPPSGSELFFFFLISIKFKQLFTEKSDVFTYMVNHYECDKRCHQ